MVVEATGAWVRCIFAPIQISAQRPLYKSYPKELKTLGDHLRMVRLDRDLSQHQVAKIFEATTDAVTNWELNRNLPTVKFASKIIQFLGYFPFEWKRKTLPEQMKYARMISGDTLEEMANIIGCDFSCLSRINLGKAMPSKNTKIKILDYINPYLKTN